MLGGSTGSRAAALTASSQDTFKGQFDSNMSSHQLIGGEMKLQQFDNFQQALTNTTSIFSKNHPEDVKALIKELKEIVMDKPDMPEESLTSGKQGAMHMSDYKDDI